MSKTPKAPSSVAKNTPNMTATDSLNENNLRPANPSIAVKEEQGTKAKNLLPENLTVLQPMVWPNPAYSSERDMYVRLNGPASQSQRTGEILFQPGVHIQFDTYFNLFNIGKWATHCDLENIGVQLKGRGRVDLTVYIAYANRTWGRLIQEIVTLDPDTVQRLDIPLAGQMLERGLMFFEFLSIDEGSLTHAAWDTLQTPRRIPELALAVTTFRREKAVNETVDRFEKFVEQSRFGDHIHMLVVDNGKSAGIQASANVTPIDNENLGGAGGFTRGLIEARDRGFTYCLFMDDDASTPMDAFERTWAFLAYATDTKTAVAGSMISTQHAWAIWENGALFDAGCKPLHGGTDLREPRQVFEMEYASTFHTPDNFYGGWWFFAFPLEHVKQLPFPFFVRGDDVSFSLVHDFNICTLPGVVSFQESFTEKDSPLTWYLDLRSHLAHHLSLPSMDIGARGVAKMALWFWGRTFVTNHYETMAAVNIAMKDVISGPQFFADNADMATRRGELGKLRQVEQWVPCLSPPPERHNWNGHKKLTRTFLKLSLSGLLIPFWGRLGNKITLPADARWSIRDHWGAAEMTYFDAGARKAYTVRHNKRRAVTESIRALRLVWQLYSRHDSLKEEWTTAYPELTKQEFWNKALKLDAVPDTETTN